MCRRVTVRRILWLAGVGQGEQSSISSAKGELVHAQTWSDGIQAQARSVGLDTVYEADRWPILICLLGEFRVLKFGQPIAFRRATKGEGLLAALALHRDAGLPREALEASLWPDADTALAHQSLHSLIHSVTKLLSGCIGGAAPILSREGNYRLNRAAGIAVDIAQFEALAREGEWQARCGDAVQATVRQNQAVALYRGDLQTGEDVHAAVERERLRARYLTLLAQLAQYHYGAGEYQASLEHALRLVAREPCREDAHRAAMRCYVRLGERAQALRQYRLCVRVLRVEFDAPPELATTELFDQIRLNPLDV